MHPNNADGKASRVDHDQTAVWPGFALFSQTWLSKNLGSLEPPHNKTNKMARAPSEDSDQSGHPSILIRVFAVHMKKPLVLSYHWVHSKDSDETGRMPRLIWVFAGLTGHIVGFVMWWLILEKCLIN